MMGAEAEFEQEALEMFKNLGINNVEELNYFQSSTRGGDKWKDGLRKSSRIPTTEDRLLRVEEPPREDKAKVKSCLSLSPGKTSHDCLARSKSAPDNSNVRQGSMRAWREEKSKNSTINSGAALERHSNRSQDAKTKVLYTREPTLKLLPLQMGNNKLECRIYTHPNYAVVPDASEAFVDLAAHKLVCNAYDRLEGFQEPIHSSDSCVQLESHAEPTSNGECYCCHKAIYGEDSGCLAMGEVYHTSCFTCSICKKQLFGQGFYKVDQSILCEIDYLKTLPRCQFCNQHINKKILIAFDKVYHPACFRCAECSVCLDGVPYIKHKESVYCVKDYHRLYAPPCASCGKSITPVPGKAMSSQVSVKDKHYHVQCHVCEECRVPFAHSRQKCFIIDGNFRCKKCIK